VSSNKKLKLLVKRLPFLAPVLFLGISLSGGVAYASSSVYAADGVLGQSSYTSVGSGTGANQLNYPSSTVIDTTHHRLFVADLENDRILVYQLDNNDQIESQSASYALGAPNPNSTGNDATNQNSFYEYPYAMAYDPVNNRLFVEDYYRVLVFNLSNGISNDMNASYVLGQSNFTNTNEATSINTLNEPGPYGGGLAFDPTNDRLFVGDEYRIMVFDVSPATLQANGNGENASYVLGQTNFTNTNEACSQSELYEADYDEGSFSLAFDNANQRLFVSDGYECSRVLVFDVSPATLQANGNGENASYVLGQTSFTSSTYNATQNNLYGPTGIGYDPTNNTLFVADYYGIRVMLFNVSPSTIANYENAYAVLGEPDFTTLNTGASQTALYYAYYGAGGFAIDPTDNQLFLPDQYNNRVLTYNFITMTNNSQLNGGTKGQSYSQALTSNYTQGTVTYSVTSGSLPSGLSLNSSTGVISGTPTTSGTYTFEITAYDNIGTAGTFQDDPSYTITIGPGTSTSSSSAASSPAPDTGYGKPVNYLPVYALSAISFVVIIIGSTALLVKK
jgi:putative Ig domain-containing protein